MGGGGRDHVWHWRGGDNCSKYNRGGFGVSLIFCSSADKSWFIWQRMKWHKIQFFVLKTRGNILCVTHQMSCKKRNYSVGSTVPYEMMNYMWYQQVLNVLGHMAMLAGTWWYWVSISWYCLILGGTGSALGFYDYWKKWRFGRVPPIPDTQSLTDNRMNKATHLV